MINLSEAFEKFKDEYIKFEKVKDPIYPRPDICAFLILDKLVPAKNRNMVGSIGYDDIWLDVDCEELAKVASEQDIETLVRCGIGYDDDYGALYMWDLKTDD